MVLVLGTLTVWLVRTHMEICDDIEVINVAVV